MAKYIPEGTEYLPGIQMVTLTLTFFDEKLFDKLNDLMQSNKTFNIGKSKFYVQRLDKFTCNLPFRGLLVSSNLVYPIDLRRRLKQKKLEFQLSVNLETLRMDHMGYVKYDWELTKHLSDEYFLITRDMIPEGEFEFENILYKLNTYWCSDCHDEHTESRSIKRILSRTKEEAKKVRQKFLRNWRKYI